MYDPPPGLTDLCSDAEDAPPSGALRWLEIDGVGRVWARKPVPASAATLARAASVKTGPEAEAGCLHDFLMLHLGDGEFERLLAGMLDSELPEDTVTVAVQSIATWGTARPYQAVATLCAITGHHWRTLRAKLLMAGIADPMALPSLHALLDHTEAVLLESMSHDPKKAKREVAQFNNSLYAPSKHAMRQKAKDVQPPAGFAGTETDDSFDRFMAAAR